MKDDDVDDDYDSLREKVKQDLLTNPRYGQFWKRFDKTSNEWFIDFYSRNKPAYLLEGKVYLTQEREWRDKFYEDASAYLSIIKQKKLYDLQCLWRAEKIKIPGVDITMDFMYWGENIERCPFIEQPTQQEVDILCEFISRCSYAASPRDPRWQEYPFDYNYKKDELVNGLYSWYHFYNRKMNLPDLDSELQDIRGKKEGTYCDAYLRDTRTDPFDEKQKTAPPAYSYSFFKAMNEFMNTYEDPVLLEYKNAIEEYSPDEDNYVYEEAIRILKYSHKSVRIESCKEWMTGVIQAAEQCFRLEMIQAIQDVWITYRSSQEANLVSEDSGRKFWKITCEHVREQVIKGRILLGEPGNFEY